MFESENIGKTENGVANPIYSLFEVFPDSEPGEIVQFVDQNQNRRDRLCFQDPRDGDKGAIFFPSSWVDG